MDRKPEVTHKIMSAIKSKNTKPEMLLRKALWARGLRYRVNVSKLKGKPDVVFSKAKIAIFCDGDFWHGHNWKIRGLNSLDEELSGYTEYWVSKINRNIERDNYVTRELQAAGWFVLRFWESDIKTDVNQCADVIETQYKSKKTPL